MRSGIRQRSIARNGRQAKDFDRAVILLTDLHNLVVHQGDETGFQLTMEELRNTHAAKETFQRRLTKANL